MTAVDLLSPRRRVLVLAIMAGLVVTGCGAHNSIFRHRNLKSDTTSITAIDAKQRAILRATVGTDSSATERFCAEPSPDVFSVVAQALSAGGSLGKSVDTQSIQASLQAAFASAEQGSAIPRTQTINMLRELMYRTCERYLSGGYSPLELSVQAVRDQRLIVSILAIEQLTGAVTPKPVVIGASGSAGSGTGESIVRIDDAKRAKEGAEAIEVEAKKALDEENGKEKECDSIADLVNKKEPLPEDSKEKKAACDDKAAALQAAEANSNKAAEHYDVLRSLAAGSGFPASTAVSSAAGGGLDRASTEAVKEVAGIVKGIVAESFVNDTEVMLFCIKVLVDGEAKEALGDRYAMLADSCLGYVQQRVTSEEVRIAAEADVSLQWMSTVTTDLFEQYWAKLAASPTDNDKRTKIERDLNGVRITNSQKALFQNCLKGATKKDVYLSCFRGLPSAAQRALAGEK